MRFSCYLLHFSHIGDTIRGQKHHPGHIKKHNVFSDSHFYKICSNMEAQRPPFGSLLPQHTHTHSNWMHQVAPRAFKARNMDQKVTPGRHIAWILQYVGSLFERFYKQINWATQMQRTAKNPAPHHSTQTQNNFEVRRCRVSVLNKDITCYWFFSWI